MVRNYAKFVDVVDHLIDPVGIPVKVPRRAKVQRGSEGIHYEKKFPLKCELRDVPVAHHAAWAVHRIFSSYFWSVWCRGNPKYIYTDDVGAATDELVNSRWQEIRDELQAFVDYDCDGLRQAVEAESKAAMDRCRQSIVGDAEADLVEQMAEWTTGADGPTADTEPEPRLVVSDGERPQAMVDGKPISITSKQADLLRLLLNGNGEYVSLAAHNFRSRDVERLPELIGQFVETQPGAGTRIPRIKLIAKKNT